MRHSGYGSSPGRHIGFRIFGALFMLLFVSAVIGGLIAWLASPNPFVFLAIGLGVVVLFGLLIRAGFRRSWAPVSELIDATTRLGEGDTSVRISSSGRGPWVTVNESFNSMAESLEVSQEQRRRLLADLSHEMRTPLTVIQGEVEAVIDGVHDIDSLHNVVDEINLMERLLADLSTLAIAESGQLELNLTESDLGATVADAARAFTAVAQPAGVELLIDTQDGAIREIDPDRITQIVNNLITNALSQVAEGGQVRVVSTGGGFTVSDDGPGIPEEHIDHIFDRFYKAADSSGNGLGLRIAKELAEAHGGRIITRNDPKGGAVFTVELP